MEKEFWKESGSSLRESQVKSDKNNKLHNSRQKKNLDKKDSIKSIRQLENAYGKYVFGIKKDKYAVMVSRKSEFKENTFDNSREHLNKNRINEKKTSGGSIYADSHKKHESAVIYEENTKNAPAERMFKNLKRTAFEGDKLTLKEMFPEKSNVEKKIFQNLKATIETLEKENTKTEEVPFFKRIVNSILAQEDNIDDAENNEENTENS